VSKTIQNRIVHDKELILRLQRGDEWAFQLMVRRFRTKIFSIAFGITLDTEESQDIMQEVFLQVYRTIGDFRGDASLATWLQRITVNRSLNWKRRWARRFKWLHVSTDSTDGLPAAEPESDLPSPETRVANAQTRQQIDKALKMLPEQARTIFVLRELEGLAYEEIAAAIGIKLGTVRSRLFHARKRLKEILQPLVEEEE
jgi:RNA polymerase sigma-70 factor (ECF subfamily)